ADARAAVDVVRAEPRAHELLRHVVLLVRAARAREDHHLVGAARAHRVRDAVRDVLERLVPGHAPPLAAARADHRVAGARIAPDEAPGVAALQARVALVRVAVGRQDLHELAVLDPGHDLAADAAIGAHRLRPRRRPPLLEHGAVEDRAGRADVGARAARDAR